MHAFFSVKEAKGGGGVQNEPMRKIQVLSLRSAIEKGFSYISFSHYARQVELECQLENSTVDTKYLNYSEINPKGCMLFFQSRAPLLRYDIRKYIQTKISFCFFP